jgi:DtxR family Mn-dependent transcriptional regulator
MKERIWIEDALKHIHEYEYRKLRPTPESVAGALSIPLDQSAALLDKLRASELVHWQGGRYQLSKKGRTYARHVLRAHRLYETYLALETGVSESQWHHEAERREHQLTKREVEDLAQRLGDPRFDPHGDPIPTPGGEMPPPLGVPLMECGPGWEGQIVHVEDEPPAVYSSLVDMGLAAGMRVQIDSVGDQVVGINAEGKPLELTAAMACNVMATPLPSGEEFDASVLRLADLRAGERATVVGLSPACRGTERSRLLDLGLVPGSDVEFDMAAPSGNPVAYIVRGASIALRREQADRVLVKKAEAA